MKIVAVACLFSLAVPIHADEGMWPFNQIPREAINIKYKFDTTPEFVDHLRLASVRLPGGAGSFVSPAGLILTNQHLVTACLGDRLNEGFLAATNDAERKCPAIQAEVLQSIEDVTAQIANVRSLEQRNATIARIEKDCGRCTVVKLFSGGRYDLYHYKLYTDVRLVFAPENELAFFGRQHDSITYLRYGLDAAFLRAYENGEPAATPNFLKWSADGIKDGDLVFASGDPVATNRLATAAQLTFYRDKSLPVTLPRLATRIQQLAAFSNTSEAHRRAAEPVLTEFSSAYKIAAGKLIGLKDDRMIARKMNFEGKVKRAAERDPKIGTKGIEVWNQVALAYKNWAPFEKAYQILASDPAPGSRLFAGAPGPVDDDLEILLLTQYFEELKALGDKEAPVKAVLAGKSPKEAAETLVKSHNVKAAVDAIEPAAERLRKKHADMIGSLETTAAEKIAQYRLKLFGAAEYPDATGTPRLEFGVVKGYTDRAGVAMPIEATFSGLYYRANNDGPYLVPKKWIDARPTLNEVAPLDFVSTCDVGGGDYGSPVVNRAGELIGVTFDGNLESLPDTFLYTDEQARAVHVSAQGIVEALRKVYRATALLEELHLNHSS